MPDSDDLHIGFSEALIGLLQDKFVEIYVGSSSEERMYSDFTVSRKEVIRGYLRAAYGELLVVEVIFPQTGKRNLVYLNSWSITSVVEPKVGASTTDIYHDESGKDRR